MKQVDIRSIVVPSQSRSGNYSTGSAVVSGGSGVAIDLSKYMKLSLWSDNFEVKTDVNGTPYLLAKKSIVSVGGLTAYGSKKTVNTAVMSDTDFQSYKSVTDAQIASLKQEIENLKQQING